MFVRCFGASSVTSRYCNRQQSILQNDQALIWVRGIFTMSSCISYGCRAQINAGMVGYEPGAVC